MVEPLKRRIDHNYYSMSVKGEPVAGTLGPTPTVGFSMVINDAYLTDEQFTRLLDIQDRAAKEANELLGW